MPLQPTPSQTAGPFVSMGTEWLAGARLCPDDAPGVLVLAGSVHDGQGRPVTDAMLEFWQADDQGRFPPAASRPWTGFTRALTDVKGRFSLVTLKPGQVDGPGGQLQAPHIDVSIFARGLLQRLVTRAYFDDEADANATDPVLASLEEPSLRQRLIARKGPGDDNTYRLDFYLQGPQESVFFAPW